MGGTKRMSKEEKRQAVLGVYHKTKQVFTEKEILTLAAKEGVNSNTIADINNELVDDGLVDKSKISGSNYFWSFPAKKDHLMEMKYKKTLQTIEGTKARVEDGHAKLADAKRGREDDDGERSKKLSRLGELATSKAKLTTELDSLKENDPQALADLEKELKFVTDAANRWTDNIFNCKTYLVKKKNMDKKQANKMLGIKDDFDYPEDK